MSNADSESFYCIPELSFGIAVVVLGSVLVYGSRRGQNATYFFESMLTFAEPFRVGRVSCGFRFAGPPCVTAGVLPRGNISELSQVSRTLSYASNLPDTDSPHDPLAHPTCLPECSSELLESVPVCHRGRSASALAARPRFVQVWLSDWSGTEGTSGRPVNKNITFAD